MMGRTPEPLTSGEVSTCAMKPMTGTSLRVVVAGASRDQPELVERGVGQAERVKFLDQQALQHQLRRRARRGCGGLVAAGVERHVAEEALDAGAAVDGGRGHDAPISIRRAASMASLMKRTRGISSEKALTRAG